MNVSIRVESGLCARFAIDFLHWETFEHKGNQKKRSYARIEETRAQKLVTISRRENVEKGAGDAVGETYTRSCHRMPFSKWVKPVCATNLKTFSSMEMI